MASSRPASSSKSRTVQPPHDRVRAFRSGLAGLHGPGGTGRRTLRRLRRPSRRPDVRRQCQHPGQSGLHAVRRSPALRSRCVQPESEGIERLHQCLEPRRRKVGDLQRRVLLPVTGANRAGFPALPEVRRSIRPPSCGGRARTCPIVGRTSTGTIDLPPTRRGDRTRRTAARRPDVSPKRSTGIDTIRVPGNGTMFGGRNARRVHAPPASQVAGRGGRCAG